jgi:hypothetical protein
LPLLRRRILHALRQRLQHVCALLGVRYLIDRTHRRLECAGVLGAAADRDIGRVSGEQVIDDAAISGASLAEAGKLAIFARERGDARHYDRVGIGVVEKILGNALDTRRAAGAVVSRARSADPANAACRNRRTQFLVEFLAAAGALGSGFICGRLGFGL